MGDWEFLASSVWNYLFFFYFILYCTPLAAGSFQLAKKVCSGDVYERFAFICLLTLTAGGINFGLCGIMGLINIQSVFLGNLLFGGLFLLLAKYLPLPGKRQEGEKISMENSPIKIPFRERILAGFLIFWALSRLYPVLTMPPFGTDTYMYHLYYPAEWIRHGGIYPVSIIGLFPEYYPIFGELLYGFLLLPMAENASLASVLQWASLVMASSCMVFTATLLGYKKEYGILGACFFFCTGLLMMNLLMAYTDVLNGALCFAGFTFMLAGCKRNSLFYLVFAGFLMGCSTSVKPLGILWSPIITLIFSLVLAYIYKPRFRSVLFLYLSALMTALPFFIRNWVETGNPLYPQKVALGNWEIFSAHISASVYEPISWKGFPSFILKGGLFGCNKATILLYALCGFFALFIVFLSLFSRRVEQRFFPEEKGGKVMKIFVPLILLFTLGHILVYPRIAEERSLILLMMFWAVFSLPLLAGTEIKVGKWGNISLAELLFFCIFLWSSYTTNFTTWGINWGMGAAGLLLFSFLSKKQYIRRASLLLLIIFGLQIPYLQTIRGSAKESFYESMFNPAENRSLEIVRERYLKGEKSVIDYVGGVFAYAYMEDMKGNKVLYIPISEKNSTFVHEFPHYGYENMRKDPVSYEVWKERLKKEKVNILIVNTNTPAVIFNRRQELDWAKAHPENFTLLVQNKASWEESDFFMYRIHDL